MKKLGSLLLSMVILLSLCISVGAKTVIIEPTGSISEYEMLKEYAGKTENQLRELGIDNETISQLFKLQQTINNYRTYSATDLKKMGFSDEQITYLKMPKVNFSSSLTRSHSASRLPIFDMEPFVEGLFAKVNIEIIKHPSNQGHTFEIYWEWSGRPFIQKKDGIVVNWDSPNELRDLSGYVIYAVPHFTEDRYVGLSKRDFINTVNKGFGFSHEVDGELFTEYSTRGGIHFTLDNLESEEELTIICQYAHATLTKKVDIIVNNDGYVEFLDRSAVSTLQKKTFTLE